MKKYRYLLEGLDCAECANEVEEAIQKDSRFQNVIVNFSTLQLSFDSEEENALEIIKKIISKVEPDVKVLELDQKSNADKKEFYIHLGRILVGILFTILGYLVGLSSNIHVVFFLIAYGILLYKTFITACILLVKSKTINENFLVTISTIGAFLIGEELEGLMVIILYEIGKLLEERAIHVTRKSIKGLMNIKSEYANKKLDNKMVTVIPEELEVGDICVVKVGEKIPVDGRIILGESHLDTSSLTGESKLFNAKVGDKVLSGSINMENVLEIEVEKKYMDSTVSKILELVENATDKKAKTETLVNKLAKVYTPIIILFALFIMILLPLLTDISFYDSIYRALTFLVISCPCAIAISVPLSYFSGIGRASKDGILIKGSNYLDALKDMNTIVFDKTGTLTTGKFEIDKVASFSSLYKEEDILKIACLGEQYSNHPIAKSILASGYLDRSIEVTNYKEISGRGIVFNMEEDCYKIGNSEFIGINEKDSGTTIYLAYNDKVIGSISLIDKIKEDVLESMNEFRKNNIEIYMFTGDNKITANEVASKLSIDKVYAEMLPNDKYQEMEKILNMKTGTVAFVGDGINDAPVLTLADIGISMGGVGSASAIESSDIVIMKDDINKINKGIKIAKYTNKVILQNLIFAFTVKVVVLILSAFGIASMWQAVFADVGVTLITIFSTLRILYKKG